MAVPTARRRSRLWLAIRVLVAIAVLAWFGHYAHLRLTVMPPRTADRLYEGLCEQRPAEAGDATEELSAVVAVLNQPAPFNLPAAPAGYAWTPHSPGPLGISGSVYFPGPRLAEPPASPYVRAGTMSWSRSPSTLPGGANAGSLDVSDVVKGEWTPATRPHLQAVIAWLASPPMVGNLAKLHRLRGRPYRCSIWSCATGSQGSLYVDTLRQTLKIIVADARRQYADSGDGPAAWEDFQTALWLGSGLPPDGTLMLLVSASYEAACLDELQHMALEGEISAELAGDMERTLRELPALIDEWPAAIAWEGRLLQAIIDACFTRDADGNGWLALSAESSAGATLWDYRSRPGLEAPVWNLASIFYNDRATVERKVREFVAATIAAGGLDYSDAVHALDTSARYDRRINQLDAHMLLGTGFYATRHYQLGVRHEATRRATRLMIALNRFKAEREQYPETLAELAPAYVGELPPDPFGAPSFGYRREAPDRYTLYSLGVDGKDDGGVPGRTDQGAPKRFSDHGDDIYTWPRAEPKCEPTLVPVQPAPATSAPGGTPESGDAAEGAPDE